MQMVQNIQRDSLLPSRYRADLDKLIEKISAIQTEMIELERVALVRESDLHQNNLESAKNLLHYLALSRHDLRQIQESLAENGLSSLGRDESHVKANVDAIATLLNHLRNPDEIFESGASISFRAGAEFLDSHTTRLLGPKPDKRKVRIMVTMPSEAATNYSFVQKLVQKGMDCMRINCAYDDSESWARMVDHARKASVELGKSCRVLMDLTGPKLRTGAIKAGPNLIKWRPHRSLYGDVKRPARIWLTKQTPSMPTPPHADVSLPISGNWLQLLKPGDVLKFFDARCSSRSITTIAGDEDGWLAESKQSSYVTSGTVLHLARPGRSLQRLGRIGKLPALEQAIILKPEHRLILTRSQKPGRPAVHNAEGKIIRMARVPVTLPQIFDDVRAGEEIWFDDGAIGGVIETVRASEIKVRIKHAHAEGSKLRADKGINLPRSTINMPALTEKDLEDVKFISRHADLVGYSFVRSASDVRQLQLQLESLGGREVGIILKIETRRAFEQLSNLLLAAMRSPSAGVMIARGDLAIECGWERMAEVQEEILWICEAAHMPVIWATQVLETLAKRGIPSRAEITDAAMGERAECVMLNKGPFIVQALQVLDDILRRMEKHQNKKQSMLRQLKLVDQLWCLVEAPGVDERSTVLSVQ